MVNPWQVALNGLVSGGIYAFIAVGYSLVYGLLGFINFAHGELVMLGGILGYVLVASIGAPPLVSLLLCALLIALLNVAMERLAYRPLRNASRLAPLISAVGLSIILRNVTAMFAGYDLRAIPIDRHVYHVPLLEATLTNIHVWILVNSLVWSTALYFLFRYTWIGRSIRATAQEPFAARCVGVSTDAVVSRVFALGGFFGALAGFLLAMDQGVEPNSGIMPGFKAFTACVIGGIGNVPGAVVGGYAIGLIEHFSGAYLSSEYRDAIVFTILIAFLLRRSEGVFTTVRREA